MIEYFYTLSSLFVYCPIYLNTTGCLICCMGDVMLRYQACLVLVVINHLSDVPIFKQKKTKSYLRILFTKGFVFSKYLQNHCLV